MSTIPNTQDVVHTQEEEKLQNVNVGQAQAAFLKRLNVASPKATIPKALDFVRTQEEKEKSQKDAFDQAQAAFFERLDVASKEMTDFLIGKICESISKVSSSATASRRVETKLTSLGFYQGIPGDVLLYGHRQDVWTTRTDLGLEIPAFMRLQAAFLAEGWYLIEESDPQKSKSIVFVVYAAKPGKGHPYFNKAGRLWHHHNMFDEEAIVKLNWTPESETSS